MNVENQKMIKNLEEMMKIPSFNLSNFLKQLPASKKVAVQKYLDQQKKGIRK